NCHYWQEAEAALIGSLRADRNECVRWEAAMALGRGCCCTKKTIKALMLSVSGGTEDGNFEEISERVKAAAEAALQPCLACYAETVTAKEKKQEGTGEKPPEGRDGAAKNDSGVQWSAYYARLDNQSMAEVVDTARRTLEGVRKPMSNQQAAPLRTGSHS